MLVWCLVACVGWDLVQVGCSVCLMGMCVCAYRCLWISFFVWVWLRFGVLLYGCDFVGVLLLGSRVLGVLSFWCASVGLLLITVKHCHIITLS